jgi:hypothetical protein
MTVAVRADERGGIVISWLFKLVLSLAIVGAVAFEAGAIVVAHVNADTAANEVSSEAAFAAANGGGEGAAQAAARVEAAKQSVRLIGVSLSDDGRVITVIVEKTARTLLVHRLSFAKSWTVVRVVRRRAVAQ